MYNNFLRICFLLAIPASLCAQWTQLDLNTDQNLAGVDHLSSGNVWIGALDTIHYSLDNGNSFTKKPTIDDGNSGVQILGYYSSIHAFDATTAIITGSMSFSNEEAIYRTTSGGAGYDQVYVNTSVGPFDYLRDIELASAPTGIAVGNFGHIIRTLDAGQTWLPMPQATDDLRSIAWAGGSIFIIGGYTETLRSVDNGSTWGQIAGVPVLRHVVATGSTCYGATWQGQIWKSIDQGLNWAQVGDLGNLIDVFQLVDINTLIAANAQNMYRSTTGGLYWEIFDLPNYEAITGIDFYDPLNGIAVGENGYAIRTNNGGGATLPIALLNAPTTTACQGDTLVFNSLNDPSYSFQWILNDTLIGSADSLEYIFNDPGTHELNLVVFNGSGYDTSSVSININAFLLVPPIVVDLESDTICLSGGTFIDVLNSEPGVLYGLYSGSTQIGALFSGNGNTLSFFTGAFNTDTLFTVLGILTGPCGTDSNSVDIPIWHLSGAPPTSIGLVEDSLCLPGSPVLMVYGAQQGYLYRYKRGNSFGSWLPGDTDTIAIILPTYVVGSQYVFTVQVKFQGLTCIWNISDTDTLHLFSPEFSSSLMDTTIVLGQFLDHSSVQGDFDQALWNMGTDASPPIWSGFDPPPVSYSSTGSRTASLIAEVGDSVCYYETSATINVLDQLPQILLNSCDSGLAGGSIHVSDMHLDGYNDHYITGQYVSGSAGSHQDLFVIKMDSLGNILWQYFHPHILGKTKGLSITADAEGNTYLTGSGNLGHINGHVVPYSSFLVKFDRIGNPVWSSGFYNTFAGIPSLRGVHCTSDNIIYTSGYGINESPDPNANVLGLPDGSGYAIQDIGSDPSAGSAFLLGLTPNGEVLDFVSYGQANHPDSLNAYTVDFGAGTSDQYQWYRTDPAISETATGDLLISGVMAAQKGAATYEFDGLAVIGNSNLDTALHETQVYIGRYRPGIGFIEARSLFGGGIESVNRLVQADDGSYWSCGRFRNTLIESNTVHEYGQQGLSQNAQEFSGYLIRTDQTGQTQWHLAAEDYDPYDLHVSADGTARVLSSFISTGEFPTTSGPSFGYPSVGGVDRAISHYSANGELISAYTQGTAEHDIGYRAVADVCGNLHVVSVSGLTGPYTYDRAMECSSCVDNLELEFIDLNGCAPNCYSAYDPSSLDAALNKVSLSDTTTLQSGIRDIRIDLSSYSQVIISNMDLGYRINGGVIQSHSWNGSLAYGDTIQNLVIGSENFGSQNHYTVQVWIDKVNGVSDESQLNDTLSLEQILCSTPISGVYTLGNIGDDFPSFRSANKCLDQCGIAATTVFEIQDGHYRDQLVLSEVQGTTDNDTIVFRSASSDSAAVRLTARPTVVGEGLRAVKLKNGAAHFTFKDMRLDNEAPLNASEIIRIEDGDHINITGCHLESSGNSFSDIISEPSTASTTRLRIEGNTLRFGFTGLGITSSVGDPDSSIVVRNNFFDRQKRRAIFAAWNVLGVVIEGNTIFANDRYGAQNYTALYLGEQGSGPVKVTGNTVLRLSALGPELIFISARPGNALPGRSLIANNMIMDPWYSGSKALNVSNTIYPLSPIDIIHNTFNGQVQILESDPTEIVLMNNLVKADSLLVHFYNLFPNSGIQSNYNVYWSTDVLTNGEWFKHNSSNPNLTLNTWQTSLGWDLNSQITQPTFVDPADLHLAPGNPFSCLPFPGITHDIDGDLRNPVITRQGADEGDMTVDFAEQSERSSRIKVYPNPSNGSISVTGIPTDGISIEILELDGRLVNTIAISNSNNEIKLDVDLPQGCYLLKLNGRERVIDQKWIVII